MKISNIALVVALFAPVVVVVHGDSDGTQHSEFVGECDFTQDCDEDHQCAAGLICADRHKKQLKAAGYDTRTANCGTNTVNPIWELCFNPSLIYNGGGFGDPHFQTYDGTEYSFHGECDLVMARSPTFDNYAGLDVHVRTTMIDNWSLISNAAIRIGKDIVEFVNDNTVLVNGITNTEYPFTFAGKYEVSKKETTFTNNEEADATPEPVLTYTIMLEKGAIKVSNYRKLLHVDVTSFLPGTVGMLGSQTVAGLVGRDEQTIVSDANEMGAQWQVRDTEPMLFNEIRAPQYPQTCTLPSVTSRRNLRRSANEMKLAEDACATVDESRRRFCVEDALLSGDMTIAHAYLIEKFKSITRVSNYSQQNRLNT
jgi:von Willebrand factor type D domain